MISADRARDLLRLALRICEDNMVTLHVDHVSHPEGCSFNHNGAGRGFSVYRKDGDRRRLEFMVSEQVSPGTGIHIPDHELLERAAVALMVEAQRVLKASP